MKTENIDPHFHGEYWKKETPEEKDNMAAGKIFFAGKWYMPIHTFTVMHVGWEMDNKGYIVEDEGKKMLLMTSHGGFYEASENEIDKKIDEYQKAIGESFKAKELLQYTK